MFFRLHHFIVHITNVDKLLDEKESTSRHDILKPHIDTSLIDLTKIRRLRNHLEHFDERLDKWIKNHDGSAFFDNNIVTGAKDFPKQAFLRALDGYTYKFYGEDFPLEDVIKIVNQLESKVHAALSD